MGNTPKLGVNQTKKIAIHRSCHKHLENCGNVWVLTYSVYFRYKIGTSSGGGYCDCGDPEAWTQNVHCKIHEQGAGIGKSHF